MEIQGYKVNGELKTIEQGGELNLITDDVSEIIELVDRKDHEILIEAKGTASFYEGANKQRDLCAYEARNFLKKRGYHGVLIGDIMEHVEQVPLVDPPKPCATPVFEEQPRSRLNFKSSAPKHQDKSDELKIDNEDVDCSKVIETLKKRGYHSNGSVTKFLCDTIEKLNIESEVLKKNIAACEQTIEGNEQSFDLYHKALMRGTTMYIAGHPSYPKHTYPDTGAMTEWLCTQIEELENESVNLRKCILDFMNKIPLQPGSSYLSGFDVSLRALRIELGLGELEEKSDEA